jgi:hypothetical protein
MQSALKTKECVYKHTGAWGSVVVKALRYRDQSPVLSLGIFFP